VSTARVRACAALVTRTVSPCKKKTSTPTRLQTRNPQSQQRSTHQQLSFAVYPTTSPRHLPPFASPGSGDPFFLFIQRRRVDSFCSGLRARAPRWTLLLPPTRVTYHLSRHLIPFASPGSGDPFFLFIQRCRVDSFCSGLRARAPRWTLLLPPTRVTYHQPAYYPLDHQGP
jgi:hypothetical protein